MVQLYHGDGKGKTTAAVGAAVRAAGRGRRVIFARFMKGRESGELSALSRIQGIRLICLQKDFPFFSQMTEAEKREQKALHDRMLDQVWEALEKKEADFVVLDEAVHAHRYALLDESRLERILSLGRGRETEVLLTGREASKWLRERSDYITRLCCERHPYERGVPARIGIEL